MRIVLIPHRFPVASETFVAALFERLLERGDDVYVVCAESSDADWALFDPLRSSGAQRRVRRSWPTRPFALAFALLPFALARCAIRAPGRTLRYLTLGARLLGPKVLWKLYVDAELVVLGPELVHFQFGSLAIGREHVGELLDCALVASFQGADINFGGLEKPGYYAKLWSRSDGTHFASDDLRRRAVRRGYVARGVDAVITPSVDASVFAPRPREPLAGRALRVLGVGRLHWKKGYEFALSAIHALVRRGVAVEYRIVGDGEHRDAIEAAIEELGIETAVTLLGVQPSEVVRDEMQRADVLLHAAVSEGFCLVALEAQAMELPVVASDADGLPGNVADGETGFVVARRDPRALADRLEELAKDDALRGRLGASGRRRALERFAPGPQIDAYRRLYADALDVRRGSYRPAPAPRPDTEGPGGAG